MANLLESYKNRIALSESVYAQKHNGAKMSNTRKLLVAKCLENTNKFLNEAFENSVGTQRSDMGLYKKFTLNLNTVALPNLIAPELVITHPMSSMSGFITYLDYTAGSNKGSVEQGDIFNGVFGMPQTNNQDGKYTSSQVVELLTEGQTKVAWTPVVEGSAKFLDAAGEEVTGGSVATDGTITAPAGAVKVAYEYDNIVIPQNDLPILNVVVKNIPLVAHARRIAIYYSQMAAFEAKTDYGFDLGDDLATQAVGQLAYEIDTEVVQLLIDTAAKDTATTARLTWNKALPTGVSKSDHYEGFAETLQDASTIIYNRTKKFAANYIIIAADIMNILVLMKGFTPAPVGEVCGPYFAGTINQLKVFVSPALNAGEYVVGVNGSDMRTSAAVYAPYMPIVPTQLLQYADGATSQGFSTLYDLKVLNENLVVKGQIINDLTKAQSSTAVFTDKLSI